MLSCSVIMWPEKTTIYKLLQLAAIRTKNRNRKQALFRHGGLSTQQIVQR
jgi:hypothetical protein